MLTISLHQEHNYPLDTGGIEDRGAGAGEGHNINIPLPPGCGDAAYMAALDRIALPAIRAFAPDAIIVACGFDASPFDPLAHMLVTAKGFGRMSARVKALAEEICAGRLVMVHEGGYSEAYVPFCGHATIATLAGSAIDAGDPLQEAVTARQPNARMQAVHMQLIDEMAAHFGLS